MNKEKIIKLFGTFFIIVGGLQLLLNANAIWVSFFFLFNPSPSRSLQDNLLWNTASLFFSFALPLATFMAGFGIIKIMKWGWWVAMACCIFTFIVNFYGTINFAIQSYRLQNMPMPKIPVDAHVMYISMWPTYMYAVISALLILLLTRKLVKDAIKP